MKFLVVFRSEFTGSLKLEAKTKEEAEYLFRQRGIKEIIPTSIIGRSETWIIGSTGGKSVSHESVSKPPHYKSVKLSKSPGEVGSENKQVTKPKRTVKK